MRKPGLLLALLVTLVAALMAGGALVGPPAVRQDPAEGFDTRAALMRLQRILGDESPHPADTGANDLVRARLVAELRAIGLQPRVSDDFACNGSAKVRVVSCARVRNVVATIGPRQGRHLLLVSHYDSTPVGPGAADDGIGTAVMLETAAKLVRRALNRPVTLLFNEGEEAGLIGARAFLARDPVAARIDGLLNFEARGVDGPAVMFETSRRNGPAMAAFARAVARPVANSMAVDFYRLLPNSTDVAVFEERGWTTLNFAIIGNETRYHSPGDRLAALDPRSVQHMGDQALALASAMAADGPASDSPDVTYADLAGRMLLMLPLTIGYAVLAVLVVGFAAAAIVRRGVGRPVLTIAAALILGASSAYLMDLLIGSLRAGDYWRAHPALTDAAVFASAVLASVVALLFVGRSAELTRLRVGFWLVFAIVGAAASIALPGATMLVLPAAAIALAGMALGRWFSAAERGGALLAAMALYLLWTPILSLVATTLGRGSAWMFAPLAALIALPWLIEAQALLRSDGKRALVPAAALTLAAWTAVALAPAYSADRKQAFGVEYASYGKPGEARWLIASDGAPLPPPLAKRFEAGTKVPWSGRERLAAPAPDGLVQAPALVRLSEQVAPGGRLLSFKLATNGAEWIMLRSPAASDLRAVRAGGWERQFGGRKAPGTKAATDGSDDYFFRCQGRSCDGLRIDLLVGSPKPVQATLIGFRAALPPAAASIVAARPANAAPQYTPDMSVGVTRIPL